MKPIIKHIALVFILCFAASLFSQQKDTTKNGTIKVVKKKDVQYTKDTINTTAWYLTSSVITDIPCSDMGTWSYASGILTLLFDTDNYFSEQEIYWVNPDQFYYRLSEGKYLEYGYFERQLNIDSLNKK